VLCPSIESVFSLTAFILYHIAPSLSTLFCKFLRIYFSPPLSPSLYEKNIDFIHKSSQKLFTKHT